MFAHANWVDLDSELEEMTNETQIHWKKTSHNNLLQPFMTTPLTRYAGVRVSRVEIGPVTHNQRQLKLHSLSVCSLNSLKKNSAPIAEFHDLKLWLNPTPLPQPWTKSYNVSSCTCNNSLANSDAERLVSTPISECVDGLLRPIDGFLIHHPVDSPNQKQPCVHMDEWIEPLEGNPRRDPVFSVIFDIFNADAVIEEHLEKVLSLTREPFEVILVVDFSRDNSVNVIWNILANWVEQCSASYKTANKTVCRNSDLVHVLLLEQHTPLWETSANNIGMRAAHGKYWILMQDDQLMEVVGWNVVLALPLRRWPQEIWASSGRCAHGIHQGADLVGRCGEDVLNPLGAETQTRCSFHMRSDCNRGPLLLNAEKVLTLGFLDEKNFHYDNDDHDINARAGAWFGWKTGWMPFDWSVRKPPRNFPETNLEFQFTTYRKSRQDGGMLSWYRSVGPMPVNEERTFSDLYDCEKTSSWWMESNRDKLIYIHNED